MMDLRLYAIGLGSACITLILVLPIISRILKWRLRVYSEKLFDVVSDEEYERRQKQAEEWKREYE